MRHLILTCFMVKNAVSVSPSETAEWISVKHCIPSLHHKLSGQFNFCSYHFCMKLKSNLIDFLKKIIEVCV
jgi:hypothetical protein